MFLTLFFVDYPASKLDGGGHIEKIIIQKYWETHFFTNKAEI